MADGDQGMAFFDECADKLPCEGRLIEPDALHKSDKTVFVLPPEQTQSQGRIYNNFTLDVNQLVEKKRHLAAVLAAGNVPGSPMARRTKHEIKSAQKFARLVFLLFY